MCVLYGTDVIAYKAVNLKQHKLDRALPAVVSSVYVVVVFAMRFAIN